MSTVMHYYKPKMSQTHIRRDIFGVILLYFTLSAFHDNIALGVYLAVDISLDRDIAAA